MKTKIIAGAGTILLIAVLLVVLRPASFTSTLQKQVDKMDGYVLKGDMEISKGENLKTYALEVGYHKGDVQQFKVSLTDKELNQEQQILKNKDGVFVITPSLNQIFKFEGDWPLNTPKPYLLQTMNDIVQQKDTKIKKEKEGYLISAKVNYPSSQSYHHEDMHFNKDGKIQWLQIYNEDNVVELKIVFNKVEYNTNFEKDYFKTPTTLEKEKSTSAIAEEDLPLYPVQVFSSKLENTSVVSSGGETRHILEYSGDKDFTVIETKKKASDETQTVIMPLDMMDSMELIGFYDGSHMSVMYDNVEFSVYSEDLEPEEMMDVISSMQVAVMK